MLYLDFRKAFDKKDHEILHQKLELCGVKSKLFSWIKLFLTTWPDFIYSELQL